MWKGKLYQAFAALVLGLGNTSMGLLTVWPSYTLPMLATSNNTILSAPLTEGEEAMIGSLASLGAMVGSGFVSFLIGRFGTKWGSILPSIGFIVSWLMVIFTRSIVVVLVARFLGGAAGGATDCIGPIYVSEIASDSIRGGLVVVLALMYALGMVFSYFIGWYCDYYAIAWINLGLVVFRTALLLLVAESPVYLMKKWRVENARKAMALFRGVPPDSKIVEDEISKIKQQIIYKPLLQNPVNENVEEEMKTFGTEFANFKNVPQPRFAAIKMLYTSPVCRKAFFLVFMSYLFLAIMGDIPVSVYAKQVFDEFDPSSADMYSVVFAVIWCAGVLLSSVLTDRVGRRALLISSSLLVSLILVLLGVFSQTDIAPGWVSVFLLMLFIFCYLFGVGVLPYVLMSELFCTEVQTLASSILIQWAWLAAFFILAIYNWLNKLVGIYGTFYIFAFNGILNAAFTYYLIPETKGLSNKEIQILLQQGRIRSVIG